MLMVKMVMVMVAIACAPEKAYFFIKNVFTIYKMVTSIPHLFSCLPMYVQDLCWISIG